MKYLKLRGNWYHFERVVPPDVRDVLGKKPWREALETDSRIEAEVRCRRRTVETDEDIQQARDGTYRLLSETEVEDIAIRWCIDFQMINRENIAKEAFPDVWGNLDTFGDEAPRPIIRKKADLDQYVRDWLSQVGIDVIEVGTPDFDALLEACLDEYLASNPEISEGWKDILVEQKVMPEGNDQSMFGTLKRQNNVDPNRKLSVVLQKYLVNDIQIGESARSEFRTGVRRFIEFHGDLDVELIDRSHAEKFRDGLKRHPVRPPNKIRALPMPQQLDWAEINAVKTLQLGAIGKNLLGVKRTLDFAFEQTSLITDRNWRNPFDGFIRKAKKSKATKSKGFTHEQVHIAFSSEVFQPKKVERFWIPLILYYTGARLDEIAQLHATDVIMTPVPHFRAENLEDEDPALTKLLKNETSHRTIPISADLIDLGFIDYAECIKQQGHTHLNITSSQRQVIFERLLHRNAIRREIGRRPIDIPTAYARKVKLVNEARYLELLDPYLVAAFGSADWPEGFTPRLLLAVRLHKGAVGKLYQNHGIADPRPKLPDMQKLIERFAPSQTDTVANVVRLN